MTVHYKSDFENNEELSLMIKNAGMSTTLVMKLKILIDYTLIEIFDK